MSGQDAPRELTRDEVLDRLRDCGCTHVGAYAALLHQTIWMRLDTTRPPTALESRFGGPAMMPDGFEWPHYTAEPYMGRDPNDDLETYVVWYAKQQKLPMFLIAQLNLAELPIDSPLTRSGLLSLFTDPFDGVWGDSKSDLHGVRVIYTPQ